MDIVDANVRGRSGDDSWSDGDSVPSRGRLILQHGRSVAERVLRRMNPAQISAALIIVGFILVLASQLFPWVRLTQHGNPGSDYAGPLPKSMGMIDEGGFLQTPYYLLWLAVFGAGGALAFLTGTRRMVAFGVGAAALASQLLIVLPLLRRPIDLLSLYDPNGPAHVKITHAAGSYLLILAFVVLVAAFVVGVEGRVFPGLAVRRAVDRAEPVPDGPYPSMHAALAGALPREPDVDISIGWSPHRVVVAADESRADESPAEEIVAEAPDQRPMPRDHSMYRRPTSQPEAAELPSFPTRGI